MESLRFFVLFLSAITSSLACSCLREHPQKEFCKAGFVVRAQVVSKPRDGVMPNVRHPAPWPYQVYTLKIMEIFKGKEHVTINKSKLYTPPKRIACNVPLTFDTEYLLYGEIVAGNLYVSYCDRREEWNAVTREQREGLRKRYQRNCRCLIGFCLTGKCGHQLRGCHGFIRDEKRRECTEKYQHCEVEGDQCSWKGSPRFQECIYDFTP